jgi:hypothetical protein
LLARIGCGCAGGFHPADSRRQAIQPTLDVVNPARESIDAATESRRQQPRTQEFHLKSRRHRAAQFAQCIAHHRRGV